MDRFLYAVIGGFLSGVLWRSIVDFGFAFLFFIVFLGFVVLLMALLSRERIVVVLVGVLLISGGLGMARFDLSDLHRESDMLDQKVGTSIRAEGIVIDEPDKRETNTNYTVLLEHVSKEPVSEKVRVVAESYPAFSYGDRIHISGELQKPKGFQTDDDRYFDYATFLSKDDIFYQMIYPQLEFVSGGEGNVIKQYLFAFKMHSSCVCRRSFPIRTQRSWADWWLARSNRSEKNSRTIFVRLASSISWCSQATT